MVSQPFPSHSITALLPRDRTTGNPRTMSGASCSSENPSSDRFFREIEELKKALDVDPKPLPRRSRALTLPSSRSVTAGRFLAPPDSHRKDKKPSSLWNWKPLRALSQIRRRRFECVFSLRVHSIGNLPASLAEASLCVHWRGAVDEGLLHSRPARVSGGVADFEESLNCRCSVSVSRSGAKAAAKYEARPFLLFVTVEGAPGLDLGMHWLDLTRLLPRNLEQLEEEKRRGRWSSSFRLSGKADGATLNVTFGYSVVGGKDKLRDSVDDGKISEIFGEKCDMISSRRRFDGLPRVHSQLMDELVTKIKEIGLHDSSEPCVRNVEESDELEFTVIEHGIEIAKEDISSESAAKKPDSEVKLIDGETCKMPDDVERSLEAGRAKMQSQTLDDLTEEVANEFLSMLDGEHPSHSCPNSEDDPESPRQQLWKQFKMEALISCDGMFTLGMGSDKEINRGGDLKVLGFPSIPPGKDSGNQETFQAAEGDSMAQMLQEWGFEEVAFNSFSTVDMGGFGSPIHVSPEETPKLPPL